VPLSSDQESPLVEALARLLVAAWRRAHQSDQRDADDRVHKNAAPLEGNERTRPAGLPVVARADLPFDPATAQEKDHHMPSFRDLFPSKYFKATDLQHGPLRGTIAEVTAQPIRDGDRTVPKYVVTFREFEKQLILNKTNCEVLAAMVGSEDPNDWVGVVIELYKDTTRVRNGEMRDCVRLRKAPARQVKAAVPAEARPAHKPVTSATASEPEDDIEATLVEIEK
jgi:hypothetical protein